MNYYHIRVYTPFVGEEMDVYITASTEEEYHKKANEVANENGMEWYDAEDWRAHWEFDSDEDDDIVSEEYYAQCGWRFIAMITEEEYNKFNAEGEWCA